MSSLTYQKTVNTAYLVGAVSLIVLPDIAFGLLLEVAHLVLELAHLLFELIESALDHLIEHTFHTGVKETQIIVFYLIVSMGSIALYFLSKTMARYFRTLNENLHAAIREYKTRFLQYWAESPSNKFKTIALFNVGLTLVVLFGF